MFVINEIDSPKTNKKTIEIDNKIINKYKPTIDKKNRKEIIFYIEENSKKNIDLMHKIFKKNNINVNIYNKNKGFKESDLIASARNSKFAIILENEKSLSLTIKKMAVCDIPVFVWGTNRPDNWDDELGCYVTEEKLIDNLFENFINNYNDYTPRDFILD